MKRIEKDELYEHLGHFLKAKGIEMKEGSYTKGIQAGCSLLVDAINLTQAGAERAKDELEKRLNQVRQVIHEKTAPKPPVTPSAGANPNNKTPAPEMKKARASASSQKKTSARSAQSSGKGSKAKSPKKR
jgi:hypothetical protein